MEFLNSKVLNCICDVIDTSNATTVTPKCHALYYMMELSNRHPFWRTSSTGTIGAYYNIMVDR